MPDEMTDTQLVDALRRFASGEDSGSDPESWDLAGLAATRIEQLAAITGEASPCDALYDYNGYRDPVAVRAARESRADEAEGSDPGPPLDREAPAPKPAPEFEPSGTYGNDDGTPDDDEDFTTVKIAGGVAVLTPEDGDPEHAAIVATAAALQDLTADESERVLGYTVRRVLGMSLDRRAAP